MVFRENKGFCLIALPVKDNTFFLSSIKSCKCKCLGTHSNSEMSMFCVSSEISKSMKLQKVSSVPSFECSEKSNI